MGGTDAGEGEQCGEQEPGEGEAALPLGLHPQTVKVFHVLLNELTKPFDDPGLQLSGPFLRDAIFGAHILQRERSFGQDAIAKDVFLPLVEGLGEFCQFAPEERLQLGIGQAFVRRLLVRGRMSISVPSCPGRWVGRGTTPNCRGADPSR